MQGRSILTVLLLGIAIGVHADHKWIATLGEWGNPDHWDQATVPGPLDKVLIDNAGTAIISNDTDCAEILLGTLAAGTGTVEIAAGVSVVVSNQIYVCNRVNGYGELRFKSGASMVRGQGWKGMMYVGSRNHGELHMEGGSLLTWGFYAGFQSGHAVVTLSDDAQLVSVGNTRVGGSAGSLATMTLRDQAGMIVFNQTPFIGYGGTGVVHMLGGYLMTSNTSSRAFTIGADGGVGTLFMGDAQSTGVISNRLSYFGTYMWRDGSMTVRNDESSQGTLRGWGTVALRLNLINNGRIIADGHNVADRTLDLSWFGTDPGGGVNNTIENTSDNGWFAVRRGKILLPGITVAESTESTTVNWGESAADTDIDLVNSARLTFDNPAAFTLHGALLAADRTDVPEGLHEPHSVWSFTGGAFDTATVTIRYDDGLAATRQVSEDNLKLWRHDGSRWTNVTATQNTETKTLTSTSMDGLGLFAVSTRSISSASVLIVR